MNHSHNNVFLFKEKRFINPTERKISVNSVLLDDKLVLTQLEIIEPELWFIIPPHASNDTAKLNKTYTQRIL